MAPAAEAPLQPCSAAAFEGLLLGGPSGATARPEPGSRTPLVCTESKATAAPSIVSSSSSNNHWQLCGLHLRPLAAAAAAGEAGRTSAVARTAAEAEEGSNASIRYSVAWQALEPAVAQVPCGCRQGSIKPVSAALTVGGRHGTLECTLPVLGAGSLVPPATTACLRAMQLLQTAVARGASSVSLTTTTASGTALGPTASANYNLSSSATLFGMLRCVASEMPNASFAGGNLDSAIAAAGKAAWLAGQGAFAQQSTAAVHHVPRLLPARETPVSTSSAACTQQQHWAVTGGTGALGLLTATWLLSQQGRTGVLLLGRSGRLAADAAGLPLLAGGGCLSVNM